MNITILKQAGIDYEAGLQRFMDDRELYETVLLSFLNDTALQRAQVALNGGDMKQFFNCIHDVKGSSGNADFKSLYDVSSRLVVLLRERPNAMDDIQTCFSAFRNAYLTTRDGIRKAAQE